MRNNQVAADVLKKAHKFVCCLSLGASGGHLFCLETAHTSVEVRQEVHAR